MKRVRLKEFATPAPTAATPRTRAREFVPPSKRWGRPPAKRASLNVAPAAIIDREFLGYGQSPYYGFRRSHLTAIRRMAAVDPVMRSLVQLVVNGVIGSTPIRPTFANLKNRKKAEELRDIWMNFEMSPTVDGRQSWRELQRGLAHQLYVDGRVFGVCRYSHDYPHGLAVQVLPREALSDTDTNEVIGTHYGIKYADSGRIVSYSFYSGSTVKRSQVGFHPFGLWVPSGGDSVEIAADLVFDLRNRTRSDSWDSYPSYLLSSLVGLNGVDKIDKATIDTMKAAACKMGFFKKGIGAVGGEDNTAADDANPDDLPEDLAYGSIDELPEGWEFQSFDPSWPGVDAIKYRMNLLQTSCAAGGLDYNSVVGDLAGVNYNSLRHFTIQARDMYRALQSDIKDCFVRPFLTRWLEYLRASGALSISSAEYRAALRSPMSTRSYEFVDPLKQSRSHLDMLATGAMSPQDIAQQSGKDFNDVMNDFGEAADTIERIGEDKIRKVLGILAKASKVTDEDALTEEDKTIDGAPLPQNKPDNSTGAGGA